MLAVRSAFVVAAIFLCLSCYAEHRVSKAKSTCPVSLQCSCNATALGLDVVCTTPKRFASDISALAGRTIWSLRLANVQMTVVPSFYFSNLTVNVLVLEYSSAESLDRNALTNISGLYSLILSPGRLTAIPEALRDVTLSELNLSGNQIRFVGDQLTHMSASLRSLSLKGNMITAFHEDAFKDMRALRDLRLSENRIGDIPATLFRSTPALKVLDLGNNLLRRLGKSLNKLPALEELFLDDNELEDITWLATASLTSLKKLVLNNNPRAFKHLQRLERLLLQNNSLELLHRASFPAKPMKMKIVVVEGNPLTCDCRLSWLSELPPGVMKGNPVCASPPWLKDAPLLSFATAATSSNWPEGCDARCTCTCRQDGSYGKYTHVDCSNANLTRPPDTFPEDTYVLDLSANGLKALSASFADDVSHLRSLFLDNNSFEALDAERIPSGLESLSIRNNRFTHFPIDVVSQRNLSALWLGGNPWACDCGDYAFRQWAASNERTIKDAAAIICADGPNPRVSSKAFMTLEQKDFCPLSMALLTTTLSTVVAFLMLMLCLTVAYLKRERQIKVWLYAHGMRCIKEDDLDKDKVFDVFLSFSSKDGDWVYANLVPGLEGAGFSVCTYDRNFKGGFLLQDIIQEAVACSRRTLLVLSENFVRSEWCRWEFRVAHHHALEDKVNRLIVVVPHSIPEGVDEELSIYMKATSYLCWGEKRFWDKLIYSLPKKSAEPSAPPAPGSVPLSIIYTV